MPDHGTAANAGVARSADVWTWLGAGLAAGLVVALLTLDRRRQGTEPPVRDFGPRAVWFVWVTEDDVPVVAREPGGAALPGTWARHEIGRGGLAGLRGSPLPRDPGAPDAPQGSGDRAWLGGRTGETRSVGDVTWFEWARWGGLTDLDELGREPGFLGRWQSFAHGLPEEVTLDDDGTVRAGSAGAPVGRWAGRGRLLVVHAVNAPGRPVHRFVRDSSDPAAERYVLDEGCVISELRR
jgi:hypothetical protein